MDRNGTSKRDASRENVDEAWDQLTDDQLLEHIWSTERPQDLENIQSEIPSELPKCTIELEYEIAPSDPPVSCAHCSRHQKHRHGFVLMGDDGRRWLLGSFCGPSAYGADYRVESAARNRAKRRAKALIRWRGIQTRLPDLISALTEAAQSDAVTSIRRLRDAFHASAPRTLVALRNIRPNHLTGALELQGSRRSRDHAAERRRDDEYNAAMLAIAHLNNKEHRRQLAELQTRYGIGQYIYTEESKDFGALRGHDWLLRSGDASQQITDVIQRLRAIAAIVTTTQDRTVAFLERLPNDVNHELKTAANALNVVRDAERFLAHDSLAGLAGWISFQAEPVPEAHLADGVLRVSEARQPKTTVSLALPPDWSAPGGLFLELQSDRV